MEKLALIIDYKFCTGCHACEVACRKEHGMTVDEWGIQLTEHGPIKFNGKWMWNYVPVPSSLCDLCAARRAEGKDPTCVHHCLAKCMEAVPLEQLPDRLAALGSSVACYVPC